MTDKQKTTQEEPRIPFAAMMRKMWGWQGQGWNCTTPNMMSQMMAMCCGTQEETDEEAAPEVGQKA